MSESFLLLPLLNCAFGVCSSVYSGLLGAFLFMVAKNSTPSSWFGSSCVSDYFLAAMSHLGSL